MSIRKILKDRIAEHTRRGVELAKTDQASALEMLIRVEECKDILKILNKNR